MDNHIGHMEESNYIRDVIHGESFGDGGVAVRKNGTPMDPDVLVWEYFKWLCDDVKLNIDIKTHEEASSDSEDGVDASYFEVAWLLYRTPFIVVVPGDKNRASDGLRLRTIWSNICTRYKDYSPIDRPFCSFLEMMVAFARRIDVDILRGPGEPDRHDKWFHMMFKNMTFDEYFDGQKFLEGENSISKIEEILDDFMLKTEKWPKKVGLWPKTEKKLATEIEEIWVDFQQFLLKNPEKFDF